MRSTRRIQKKIVEHRRIKCDSAKQLALLLQIERQRHQATVAELRTILKEEREEINAFLKDMKQIIDEMPSVSTMSNIQQQINVIWIDLNLFMN